jgi:signal transduction histidine kinase
MGMEDAIRVLLVEDDPADALLLQSLLVQTTSKTASLPRFVFDHVKLLDGALNKVDKEDYNVVLLDLTLPDSRGVNTFDKIHTKAPILPIIVLTGFDDEKLAIEIVRRGAQDYLVKGHIDGHLMIRAIRYAIERQMIEAALRKSEGKNRALLYAIPDLMFQIRKDGTVLDCKQPKDDSSIGPDAQILARKVTEVMPKRTAEQMMYYIEKTLETGEFQIFEYQALVKGDLRENEARVVVCGEDEVLMIVRDVTDRKRLEREILEIAETEQRRIGQDLHDGLGQHLTGIAFMSKSMEGKLSAKALPEAVTAAKIATLTNQAIAQTRDLARGLYPMQLKDRGLYCALEELASNVESIFSISCKVESEHPVLIADQEAEIHLYRIAQETINNAIKHGKSKNIVITLSKLNDRAVLSIRSDGLDFPQVLEEKRSMGINTMRYRAGIIHGSLEIKHGESGGACVTCTFPNSGKPKTKRILREPRAKSLASA